MKCAIVTFFDSYPPKTGSGRVCFDFFLSWPIKRKKLFQFSQRKTVNKNIKSIIIKKNKPIFKILKIFNMILSVKKYFQNEKKKILILEGPSWVFYSFIMIIFFQLFEKDIFIIYRSHSIEYEIRKTNSNKLISYVTKIFENYVINNSNISTSVSTKEQYKFKKLYSKRTYLFPNSLNIKNLQSLKEIKIIRKLPNKFVMFSGSYDYKPNRIAIDFIIKNLIPELTKKKISLVLTGNHKINFYDKNIINLKFISTAELKYLHRKSICLLVPIFEGYGTRIKILEALIWNNRIISTQKGIEGINYRKNENIIIANNKKNILKAINIFQFKKNNYKTFKQRLENISMEENCRKLYNFVSEKFIF